MSIERKIHYCWFGNKEKPSDIKYFIDTWSKMDGYEIIEWNETNININMNKYVYENYMEGKYAFVSDYIRLKVLYDYGGIYLDTDVEIFKTFDDKFLENELFLSFMFDCNLSTAIIGAKKNNKVIKELLDIYDKGITGNSPNNDLFTKFIIDNYSQFKLNNKYQLLNNEIAIYPKEYFECPTNDKDKGYSMHHFNNSWIKKNKFRILIKNIMRLIVGNTWYHQNMRKRAIKKSPFYDIYKNHNGIIT